MATTPKITRIQGIQTVTDAISTPADISNMPGFRASSVNTPLFMCTIKPCKSYFESRETWLQHRKVAHPNMTLDASQVATYADVFATLLPARSRPQPSAVWSPTAPQMPANPYVNPMHSPNMTMRSYGMMPVIHPQMMPMHSVSPQIPQTQHTQHAQHGSHMQYQDYDQDMYNQPYVQQYQQQYQHQHQHQHPAYTYNQYQYNQGYQR